MFISGYGRERLPPVLLSYLMAVVLSACSNRPALGQAQNQVTSLSVGCPCTSILCITTLKFISLAVSSSQLPPERTG